MLHIDFIKYWAGSLVGFYSFLSTFNFYVAVRTFKKSSPSRDGDDVSSRSRR